MRYLISIIFISLCFAGEAANPWVTITGTLRDFILDPTDSRYSFLYIQTPSNTYYTAVADLSSQEIEQYERSFGAQVEVFGELVPTDPTFSRLYCAQELRPRSAKFISILEPPAADPFTVANETNLWHKDPLEVSAAGLHTVRGKVLATWNGESVLVRMQNGKMVDAELRGSELPPLGATIDLVGYPETTLYNLRLNRALWREAPAFDDPAESSDEISPAAIVTDEWGNAGLNMFMHGKLLRLKGLVRSLPKAGPSSKILTLECDGYTIPINAEALRDGINSLEIGSTVEITGVCVMNVDIWRPNAVFPKIRDFSIVTRTPADLCILSGPPWLTPLRATVLVAILLAVILGILVWNYSLRVSSERRGRQLAEEQILRAESDLKVQERTRLAVELHDALSQSLAGIALQLKTVAALADLDPSVARDHLAIADRSLLSCREDLRNCLHDLRSAALEEPTMDAAIRKTLAPHVDAATVSVRFNVPRERFTDKAAHALLCIIRELVLNAVRHGAATEVKVAGAAEDGHLLVSVRDNGRGFDPTTRPGVKDGHFGLQGIQERIQSFNGKLSLDSNPGRGTCAKFSIALPQL